jgi:histidine kinase/histidine kinase/DNA gyrase B/HSP90-like ATPase
MQRSLAVMEVTLSMARVSTPLVCRRRIPSYSARVNSTPQNPRPWPRWLIYAGLWVLLTCVFGSQLYFAGYVTSWQNAFASEAVYWLSWWILSPMVFWWCRRLRDSDWRVRAPALLLGALIAVFLAPLIAQLIRVALSWLHLCPGGDCEQPIPLLSAEWFRQSIRVAGINLPVYAGVVLAWHAGTFYRDARDRQMRAVELESLLQQAQLEALRSQLNPHFLFNALHSMAELVHTDPKLAEQLILRLGELLRQVLQSSTRQEVTLAEELEFIRGYVEIEQMRLGERLRVTWDIEAGALEARVPSLILQPLVENALQHGVAATTGAGTLLIAARRDARFLQLEIGDNGPGLAQTSVDRRQGIGLANTRARLQRLYGDRQCFELLAGEGLTVRVRIPVSQA